MKNRILIIGLFLGLALIQIATPLGMIAKREAILREGTQFRFKTAPVDPYDAFRGRYVFLAVEENRAAVPAGLKLTYGQKVYANIKTDASGFAKISDISLQRPSGNAYLQTEVGYVSNNVAHLRMPFDRFYMEEKAAPKAESAYRTYSRRDRQDAYVLVRIKSGYAVIEDLYVGGVPIKEFIKRQH